MKNLRFVLPLLATLPATDIGSQEAPRTVPPASGTIDAATQRVVIDSVAAAFQRRYVDADTGRLIADHVRRRLREGAYSTLTDPMAFARAVTADLKAINGDEHLFMIPASGGPGAGPAPMTGPAGGMERLINHGIRKAEILPGNVGYLEVTEFAGGEGANAAIAGALRFLERTDAIIIDVRNNRGGYGEMSHQLFSHFLPVTPVPTVRVRDRVQGTDEVLHSDSVVHGPRRPDVPLYVLTSRATVSAAEEFAFVLRRLGRAQIVGDRTIGAGHMNDIFPIGHGFVLSVSVTRVSDPVTGEEWERVGVQPTIVAPPASALEVARAHALQAVAERGSSAQRRSDG